MKKKFFISVLMLFIFITTSYAQFNIVKNITLGSDIYEVQSVLDQKKVNYGFVSAGGPLSGSYDCRNPKEIAELIVSRGSGLGEMLYKDSFQFMNDYASLKFETSIYFYDDICSNIKMVWFLNYNPSLKDGYRASKQLREKISNHFKSCSFGPAENVKGYEKYVMQVSETVTISIRANKETLYCEIEDSEIQKPYKALANQVEALVKELRK